MVDTATRPPLIRAASGRGASGRGASGRARARARAHEPRVRDCASGPLNDAACVCSEYAKRGMAPGGGLFTFNHTTFTPRRIETVLSIL